MVQNNTLFLCFNLNVQMIFATGRIKEAYKIKMAFEIK